MENPQILSASLERHLSLSDDPGFRAFMEAMQPLPNEDLGRTIVQAMQKRHKDPPCSHLTACLGTLIGAEQVTHGTASQQVL
ncbi:hypothetical protein DUNSADRAFT_8797 [Dunaliella salina]|uniref:Uncharacterized protein n=1 Tax=Dunaliella salina TaxID=3046 RepID=A0ABQ7GIW8_DUNSA|nr:hypothetical protein DUNSADRAFT_8797 [Dunaliella salina]|eukprot:KAF5834504.1 hypothetical protein DUNSADRAFT_8797 [Dunaliella salina]